MIEGWNYSLCDWDAQTPLTRYKIQKSRTRRRR